MSGLRKGNLRGAAFMAALFVLSAAHVSPSRGQATASRDDIVAQLDRFETGPELDLPALRQKTLERAKSRSRNEPPADKRPPMVPELLTLPGYNVDIRFDTDTPIVRPQSYETLGRIADALVHAKLLQYSFLIVGHIEANGKRENNVILSQRRADAIRDIMVNTFKISAKRIQAIGLGEEQLLDSAHPTSATNQQIQILTFAKMPEPTTPPPGATTASSTPAAKKKPAKKK
jgi:OmpA-OmpF porin, OOP family